MTGSLWPDDPLYFDAAPPSISMSTGGPVSGLPSAPIAADVEELVVCYLSQYFPNVGLDMPPLPPLPFYLVNGVSDSADWVTDRPVVSVHAFAATRTDAAAAGRALRSVMNPWVFTPKLSFALSTGSTGIDRFCVREQPSWQPYEDPNLERYCGRYRIDLRNNQTS